jgi:hypothetical protein
MAARSDPQTLRDGRSRCAQATGRTATTHRPRQSQVEGVTPESGETERDDWLHLSRYLPQADLSLRV